ncbi:unnamed protein product [Lampetra fluviatilis]
MSGTAEAERGDNAETESLVKRGALAPLLTGASASCGGGEQSPGPRWRETRRFREFGVRNAPRCSTSNRDIRGCQLWGDPHKWKTHQ